jgi:hypothetical protein
VFTEALPSAAVREWVQMFCGSCLTGDHLPHVLLAQSIHRHGRDVRARGPRGPELGTRREQQKHRGRRNVLAEELEQLHRRRIGPHQVLDDEHHRLERRGPEEPLDERRHQPLRLLLV